VKAGHPVPPANQVVTGSPAFAGDDTQVMQLFSDAYLRALRSEARRFGELRRIGIPPASGGRAVSSALPL